MSAADDFSACDSSRLEVPFGFSPRAVAILQRLRAEAAGDVALTDRLCVMCARALRVDGAALSLRISANFSDLIGGTPGLAAWLDEVQFDLGEGPTFDALRRSQPLECVDIAAAAEVWPLFVPVAVEAGAAAAFVFCIVAAAVTVGVLTVYRRFPGPLSVTERAAAGDHAEAAAALLVQLAGQLRAGEEEPEPQLAGLTGRRNVHMATGMVSAQAGIGMDDALTMLRARAFAVQTSLRQLADDVIAGRVVLDG